MPTLEDILEAHQPRTGEPPDPGSMPQACGYGQHVWPPDWQSGDACLCGTLYLIADGARLCVSEW